MNADEHRLPVNEIVHGDCLEVMRDWPDNSVDAVVTDPPYELGFMGKQWDSTGVAYRVEVWAEVLRILKPGGHLLAFGGTRTYHRMACAIEDAGFEIRDQMQWLYGSGFPKSLNISKAIDRVGGKGAHDIQVLKDELRRVFALSGLTLAELNERCGFEASGYLRKSSTWALVLPCLAKWQIMRDVIGTNDEFSDNFREAERTVIGEVTKARAVGGKSALPTGGAATTYETWDITAPATEDAKRWDGWGTALKPANEPICVARKPLSEGTVAANVLKWGTGGLNIDGGRIGCQPGDVGARIDGACAKRERPATWCNDDGSLNNWERTFTEHTSGRWPANLVLDEEAAAMLDEQSGELTSHPGKYGKEGDKGSFSSPRPSGTTTSRGDSGGASRFFYCAKASRAERERGLGGKGRQNNHPTVKPLALMGYLVRFVAPLGGIILDPFCGSGTTCVAAKRDGFDYIGIDILHDYCEIARRRVAAMEKSLFAPSVRQGEEKQ